MPVSMFRSDFKEIKGDTNSDKCSRRIESEYPDRASATAVRFPKQSSNNM